MRAFGPFRNEQRLSFDGFSDIFLITGKTGSGKSTIFDAMMYALYGRLPGSRDAKSIVSDFMESGDEPLVELVFSIRGNTYRVIRRPVYFRAALKGRARPVEVAATAECFRERGGRWEPVASKPQEVNDYIGDLIRLTAEEFSKIVLLPQGEFQQFLMADTREKTKLLEKLFPTDRHERVSTRARERARELKKEAEIKHADLEALLRDFDPRNHDAARTRAQEELHKLEADLAGTRTELLLAVEKIARAGDLEKDHAEREAAQEALAQIRSRADEIAAMERRARLARQALDLALPIAALRETVAECAAAQKKLAEEESMIAAVRQALEGLRLREKQVPRLEELITLGAGEVGRLKALLPRSAARDVKVGELALQKKACDDGSRRLDELGRRRGDLGAAMLELKKSIQADEEALESFEAVVRRIALVTEKRTALARLAEKHKARQGFCETIDRPEKDIQLLGARREAMKSDEARLLALRDSSTAAGLARRLRSGEPCPVCGSPHHPAPAAAADLEEGALESLSALSLAVIDAEKSLAGLGERAVNLRSMLAAHDDEVARCAVDGEGDLDALTGELAALEGRRDGLEATRRVLGEKRRRRDDLEAEAASLGAAFDVLNEEVSALKHSCRSLEREIESLSRECGSRDDLLSAIESAEKDMAANRKTIEEIAGEKRRRELELEGALQRAESTRKAREASADKAAALETKLAELAQRQGFASPDEAGAHCLEREAIESLERQVGRFVDEQKVLEKTVELLAKKIGDRRRPDMAALEGERRTIEQTIGALEGRREELRIAARDLDSLKTRFDGLNSDLEKIGARAGTMLRLADDLTGKNPRNLTFQNFVLGAYLEEVAGYASARLHSMSEERYTLVINEEISHGNREAGLDLDVFDAYTGQKRGVKSLSGGEKFLASIALALGLADAIQARSGGIELDAIFIDEGFGSLDDAALDRALTILDDIRANRMVGVISHVSELKNRIPAQVRVIKGPAGSSIEI
jgi:exonuclease SbcC